MLFFVGMTRLELATTRPPDAYANQLRHIPNFGSANVKKNLFLGVSGCKGTKKIRLEQENTELFVVKNVK